MGVTLFLSGKTFLITGATGRLGVGLTSRLEELGAKVIPLITPGYPDTPSRIIWDAQTQPVKYEVINFEKINFDYVINLHWRVKRDLEFTEQVVFETEFNINRLKELWESLRKKTIRNFVNISSVKIFGKKNTGLISADEEPKPDSPYGIVKLDAENFFNTYFNSFFPVTHLRLCSVASFGEHPSQLMSRLFSSAFTGEKITINSGHSSSLLFIDEAVDLIISAAINSTKNRYILSPGRIPNDSIFVMFENISGKKLNAEFINLYPDINDPVFISDIGQLADDWVRKYSTKDIIKKIIELNKSKTYQLV